MDVHILSQAKSFVSLHKPNSVKIQINHLIQDDTNIFFFYSHPHIVKKYYKFENSKSSELLDLDPALEEPALSKLVYTGYLSVSVISLSASSEFKSTLLIIRYQKGFWVSFGTHLYSLATYYKDQMVQMPVVWTSWKRFLHRQPDFLIQTISFDFRLLNHQQLDTKSAKYVFLKTCHLFCLLCSLC